MCTIHSQVLEENQGELVPGAVLILRQVHYNDVEYTIKVWAAVTRRL